MDASSFALRISWLKFEPKVSNFSPETKGLLPSVATIKQSLSLIRTLINIRPQEKTSRSSISPISQTAYRTGKIETLGSIFRHETAKLFAAVPCYYNWEVYFEYINVCRFSSLHSLQQIESRTQELKSQP